MYSSLLENYGEENWMVISIKCSFKARFFVKKDLKEKILPVVESGIINDPDQKNTKAIIDKVYEILPKKYLFKITVSLDRRLKDRYILVSIR